MISLDPQLPSPSLYFTPLADFGQIGRKRLQTRKRWHNMNPAWKEKGALLKHAHIPNWLMFVTHGLRHAQKGCILQILIPLQVVRLVYLATWTAQQVCSQL